MLIREKSLERKWREGTRNANIIAAGPALDTHHRPPSEIIPGEEQHVCCEHEAPDARGGAQNDGHCDRRGRSGRNSNRGRHCRCRRPPRHARAHGRGALSYRAFLDHQGGVRRLEQAAHHGQRAPRRSRSTPRTPSGSRSPRVRSAGPRWKAATRSFSTANAWEASA